MQYLGQVKTLKAALAQGEKMAKETGHTFVWEKAKYKDRAGRYLRCYRGWLDRTRKSPKVMSMAEWDASQKKKGVSKRFKRK